MIKRCKKASHCGLRC